MGKGNNQNTLNGLHPLSYLGVNPSSPSDTVFYDFDPNTNDNNFDIGTIWINTTPLTNNVWILTSLALGVATWILIATYNGEVSTITTDGAVIVPPISDNINLLGDGINITTVGNAGTATINVTLNDSITLPATNGAGTSGVINIGGQRFVSGFDANAPLVNAFFGGDAGNLTLTGTNNTAVGHLALNALTTGDNNTALGSFALGNLTDKDFNTAIGSVALDLLTSGERNTAVGYNALGNLDTGDSNIALGYNAGSAYTTGEDLNIVIGHVGIVGESDVIRIGFTQNECHIVGIDGVNVGSVATVVTEAGDQLGTAVITAGAGISVTPGANTITIAATTAFFTWQVVAVNTPIVTDNGYIANGAGTLTFSLPAVSVVGDEFAITGMNNATGWQVTQGAGQQIFIGLTNTTLGAGGSLTSSATRDSIQCVCIVANTTWQVISMVGNITIV